MDLFSEKKQLFNLPNAQLLYISEFFTKREADTLYEALKTETPWQEDDITVFGKTYKQPRLTALYGESDKSYSYSSITMQPLPFTETLKTIKGKVEEIANCEFNVVLLNLYRNGNDSNGWHADNEKVLGTNPIIGSVSFGETRPFHFKHRRLKEERHKLLLEHGSLLVMKKEMQHYWLHQIAKTKKQISPRINLTFRSIK